MPGSTPFSSDAPMPPVLRDQPHNPRDHRRLLPTPILPWVLENELQGYDTTEVSCLIQGFTTGFKIPQISPITGLYLYKRHASAQKLHSETQSLIRKELETGRVAGPFKQPPFPNFVWSPIGLRPKQEPRSFRIIHDLSFPPTSDQSVNAGVPEWASTVQYHTLDCIVSLLHQAGKGSLMAKCDLKHAFRLVPVSPQCYHVLGFRFDNEYY